MSPPLTNEQWIKALGAAPDMREYSAVLIRIQQQAHRAGFSAGLEAGAKECEKRLGVPHEWTNCQREVDLMDAEAKSCAARIRALLAEAMTTTERGSA